MRGRRGLSKAATLRAIKGLAGGGNAPVRGPKGEDGADGAGLVDGVAGDITVSGGGTVLTVTATLDTLPAPTAAVDFNDQQATAFRIENRTDDPASPSTGQLWLRTDL